MNLRQYEGKNVLITTEDQKKFAGKAIEYVFPEDNDSEEESIIIRAIDGQLIEFRNEEIKDIEETK